jgi:hypothetical protein
MWERHEEFNPMIEETWIRGRVPNVEELCSKIKSTA